MAIVEISDTVKDNLKNLGVVVDHLSFDYESTGSLSLTNTYQQVTSWTADGEVENFTETNGDFSPLVGGRIAWAIERIYKNIDSAIDDTLTLFIQVRKNGTPIIQKSFPLSEAKSPNNPSAIEFNTPKITEMIISDVFTIWIKAETATQGNPEAGTCTNENVHISGFKIKET